MDRSFRSRRAALLSIGIVALGARLPAAAQVIGGEPVVVGETAGVAGGSPPGAAFSPSAAGPFLRLAVGLPPGGLPVSSALAASARREAPPSASAAVAPVPVSMEAPPVSIRRPGRGGLGATPEPERPPARGARTVPTEKVVHLRPTQMTVGQREVDARADKLRSMKPRELREYLRTHPVPVVLGPQGRVYLVDHHHLARAAWEAGVESLHLELKADLSGLSPEEFWRRMKDLNWVYPYDQFGGGPHEPTLLPENIKGLADDPFRSVAWKVRELGGYEKSEEPFAEFLWADFFRGNLKVHPIFHDFDEAVTEALALAGSPKAKHLPGYSGR